MTEPGSQADDVVVLHTSDLHLGARIKHGHGDPLFWLRAVLAAAQETRARVAILAGDIFDSHRAGVSVLEDAAALLDAAACDVVILPGNHDPASAESLYHRDVIRTLPNVHILGVTEDAAIRFPALRLEVAGRAHMDFADFPPLATVDQRTMRWHIVVAHGHWVRGPHDHHRGWLIRDDDLASCGADYVALGHWDVPQPAGDGRVPAYYSGSPELARTVNIVRLGASGVAVERHPLRIEE